MTDQTGANILDLIETYTSRFVYFPSQHALTVVPLWCAFTHLRECFDTSPRLVVISPGPGMGKSRVLKMLEQFSYSPLNTFASSSAFVFRKLAQEPNTALLLDESDPLFRSSRTPAAEEMRTMVNGTFDSNASVGRMEKLPSGGFKPVEFRPSGSIALGGIGRPPATIASRSVVINMMPPPAGRQPEPWRARDNAAEAAELRDGVAAWADTVGHKIARSRPHLPPSITGRRADVWEPLIAIADAAGGRWPQAARDAAVWFAQQDEDQPLSRGVQLLADIRTAFTEQPSAAAMWTDDLIVALRGLPESTWDRRIGGFDLNPRRLAGMLADYQVRPRDVRQGDRVKKGYRRDELADAWRHYLPQTQQHDDAADPYPALGERAGARRGTRRGRRTGRNNTTSAEEA